MRRPKRAKEQRAERRKKALSCYAKRHNAPFPSFPVSLIYTPLSPQTRDKRKRKGSRERKRKKDKNMIALFTITTTALVGYQTMGDLVYARKEEVAADKRSEAPFVGEAFEVDEVLRRGLMQRR